MDEFLYKDEKPELSEEEMKEILNFERVPHKRDTSRNGFLNDLKTRKYNILDEYRKRSIYVVKYRNAKLGKTNENYVNKTDIINQARAKLEVGYGELSVASDALFDTIMENLISGKDVHIKGFGYFQLSREKTISHKSNYYKHISYRRSRIQNLKFIPGKLFGKALLNVGEKEYFWTETGGIIHNFIDRITDYIYLARKSLYDYIVLLNKRRNKK